MGPADVVTETMFPRQISASTRSPSLSCAQAELMTAALSVPTSRSIVMVQ